MRIAYLSQMADVSRENGITKKILSQISSWTAKGHTARYFALAPNDSVWAGFMRVETTIIPRGNALSRFFNATKLAAAIRTWRPDLIYYRYGHHVPGLPALFRMIPTIAEINSDDLREYPLKFPLRKRVYHRITRTKLLRSVSAFVPVTAELGQRLRVFGKAVFPLGNSITVADYETCAPVPNPDSRHMIFLGSPSAPWHGLDRIAELSGLLPHWTFDIVGSTAKEARSISPASSQPANQVFHGHLDRRAYEGLLAPATAALGSFALWRNKMEEASPLKVREYLARGLPVIAAYKDTDIPDDADYFLRLPNDAAPLAPHVPKINAFLSDWQTRRVPRAAILHIDTSVKEASRLAFMTEIVARFRRNVG
jgi:glycosyltransferase involved in cell wall biosynthesis